MKKIILFSALAGACILASCTQVRPGMVSTAKSIKTAEMRVKKTRHLELSAATLARKEGITKIATVDWGKSGRYYFIRITGE